MKFPVKLKRIFNNNLLKMGILNNTFKQTLTPKYSRIKVYSALALPVILYGIEFGTLEKRERKKD